MTDEDRLGGDIHDDDDADEVGDLPEAFERYGIPHLVTQFSQARPILFTGAGFSRAARNRSGKLIPTGTELAKLLWGL